ncbi:MAG: CHAT domain-containing protein [Geitlerinemataceae cyanobacterium]
MIQSERPYLSLALKALNHAETGHFAIWVVRAPTSNGYVHEDTRCLPVLAKAWEEWQAFFSIDNSLPTPHCVNLPHIEDESATGGDLGAQTDSPSGYGSMLMQELGLYLWHWLFSGSLQRSLALGQGMALERRTQLRISLDVRDPNAIGLPWEIAMPQPGQPVLALDTHIAFSRTVSDVMPLAHKRARRRLKLAIAIGDDGGGRSLLDLHTEARALAQTFASDARGRGQVEYQVDTLVQPTPEELIECLDRGGYNIFIYLGHGVTAPDGGELQLSPDCRLSGAELAQVLVRSRVSLALVNACWGARSHCRNGRAIPRSSLAELLIHHGVPAVLAMRDAIADEEAHSFTSVLAKEIALGLPIDSAVAIARQQLLTVYKFNQPAWTLPVLYMHPEFDGYLLEYRQQIVTELPDETGLSDRPDECAYLVDPERGERFSIRRGLMRIGRTQDNDIIVPERWVSQQHAEIFFREAQELRGGGSYVLRDRSRYGTFVVVPTENRCTVHHQEVVLEPGMQLKFGSSHGRTLEFAIEAG